MTSRTDSADGSQWPEAWEPPGEEVSPKIFSIAGAYRAVLDVPLN